MNLKRTTVMTDWTVKDMPPQTGRIAVVTGATSGIGYEAALALAGAGARVVLASRNEVKGAEMIARIRAAYPRAEASFEPLDLASLKSVSDCADRLSRTLPRIDLLVNNAGVMAIPARHVTVDGFEMQFGANYVGHFALTLRLLPLIHAGQSPRVVTLSSLAHRSGKIHFDDLQFERGYRSWAAYCQSKLATLLFSMELERRARANDWTLMSTAAHPGFALTALQSVGPSMGLDRPSFFERSTKWIAPFVAQSAAAGALPTLYAATSPDVKGGTLYGPNGFYEMKGSPRRSKIVPSAFDQNVWRRLWDASERMTGLTPVLSEAA
jgi:NAD(P)-dependent dehydrogenase (short-subunit alcohol dehydrogenase family)